MTEETHQHECENCQGDGQVLSTRPTFGPDGRMAGLKRNLTECPVCKGEGVTGCSSNCDEERL